jgi:integrase
MRHVERTRSGTYKVRFRHGKSERTGKPLQSSETFERKADAERFARLLDALGPQGALDQLYADDQAATVPTLDQLAADHIANLTGVEPGTRKTYSRLWARTWAKHLGSISANLVSRDDVARAVNKLAASYSHKSLENQRGLLAAVLTRAVDLGYLPKNPAKGIRLPRGQEAERVEMVIITPDEFAGILERVPAHYQPFVRFLFGTGCRWGEAVALTVGDVSLPNVRIRRALKWSPDNDRQVGATKTRRSNRTVAVGDVMLADLRAACEGKARTDLVFTAPKGGQILHRTFWSRVWLPAVAHIEPRPRIHDLRHSHASWLLAQGLPIHVVQMRLGHESIQTTVNTYGHLLPDAQALAASAASLAFTRGQGRPALQGQGLPSDLSTSR